MLLTNFTKCFFQKYFVVHELWAGKDSFSTYVSYTFDVLFWWIVFSLIPTYCVNFDLSFHLINLFFTNCKTGHQRTEVLVSGILNWPNMVEAKKELYQNWS